MIIKIVVIVLCLMLYVSLSVGSDIFVVAKPLEDTDYYIISIDGEEITTDPSFDMILFYGVSNLQNGKHRFKITTGSWDYGEGATVFFFLEKRTKKGTTTYRIKKDKRQNKIDPWYNDRFDEPLTVEISEISKRKKN